MGIQVRDGKERASQTHPVFEISPESGEEFGKINHACFNGNESL